MSDQHITRRQFIHGSAAVAAGLAVGWRGMLARAEDAAEIAKTRSYNPDMEYRRLGKTGAWVSAICLGGHWKRVDKAYQAKHAIAGIDPPKADDREAFDKNRYDVVTRCIEHGINLIDACTGAEVMAYAKAIKGRRDSVFLDYSWAEKEMRFAGWQTADKLLQGLDEGLKEAGLEYIDLWRITCFERGSDHTPAQADEFAKALEAAKKAGKCRFTGISSHDRKWLKSVIEKYPQQIQVVLTPYTADSSEMPTDSLFESVRKCDVGVLGIKPFSSNAIFKGDSSPNSPHAEVDDRIARLTIRYILSNPGITAPIPGLISQHQVDNVVAAVKERRQLDRDEKAELKSAAQEMWARLPEDYQWLKEWRYV